MIENVIADIQITIDEKPNVIMNDAGKYEDAVLNELVSGQKCKITSSTVILHTGFSLGGYLAAASLLSERNKQIRETYGIQEENVFAVTLDAPGFKNNQANGFYSNRITNYVTRPNLVNTCNRAIGKVIQILNYKSNDTATYLETVGDLMKEIKDNTLESHNLEKLVEVLKKRIKTHEVSNWPEATFNFSDETFKNILSNLSFSSIFANLNYRRSNEVNYLDDDKFTMV